MYKNYIDTKIQQLSKNIISSYIFSQSNACSASLTVESTTNSTHIEQITAQSGNKFPLTALSSIYVGGTTVVGGGDMQMIEQLPEQTGNFIGCLGDMSCNGEVLDVATADAGVC